MTSGEVQQQVSSSGPRLSNPVPHSDDERPECGSGGAPKERAKVEVTVPQPLHRRTDHHRP